MPAGTQTVPVSKTTLWVGRVISALMIVFMFFDAGIKILKLPPAVEGTIRLGYPASTIQPVGFLALVCVLLYAIPRTSILGAILLTGFLGGATATQVRVQDPWFIFPAALGPLIWAGLYLRDDRLRALIPLNRYKGEATVMETNIQNPKVVSRSEWLAIRKELLAKEKELTRARDVLSAQRRQLPWVKVEKEYVFDTADGKKTLADLFEGRSQLIVYHFMWRRDMDDRCVGCSFLADHIDGANLHLAHHDVSFVVCSRASVSELKAYKKRMGWRFNWVSSYANDFNYDYHVSFTPNDLAKGEVFYNYTLTPASIEDLSGISVFYKDASGNVFHTYSSYGRGNEEVLGAYMYLDLTPNGRDETGPNHNLSDWVRHHDRYGQGGYVDATGAYVREESKPCCHLTE